MTVERIRRFLDENDVHYRLAPHPAAFTAQEVAAEAHVPGRHFAKVVTINVDDRLALAVLPATDQIIWSVWRDRWEPGASPLRARRSSAAPFPTARLARCRHSATCSVWRRSSRGT